MKKGKDNPQDDKAKEQVTKFCDYIVELKGIRHIGKELFEDGNAKLLMEQTAEQFFFDVNMILIKYFILEVAKITDRSKSGNYENFTVANIIESIDWPKDVSCDLQRLNEKVGTFRRYIAKARDKAIAHYDKETFLSGTTLGGFPEGEDVNLIATLEEIANIMHKACFGCIFGAINPIMQGGVLDFKDALRKAVAFQKLLLEGKGEELVRLANVLRSLP